MTATRPPASAPFSRRISVETPEHVVLHFELAGAGSRVAAGLYDLALVILLLILVFFVLRAAGALGSGTGAWVTASLILVYFAAFWGYFALFEALAGGRTPGKRRVGIRVVMDTGHPITFQAAVIRNLVRLVDAQPVVSYGVGLVSLLFHPLHKRLGDLVAGTIVVRDRPEETSVSTQDVSEDESLDAGTPVLTDEEFQLVDRLVQRLFDLPPDVRARLAGDLANRLADRIPHADPRPERFLRGLHATELAKRRAKSAARRGTGGITASGTAQRFVAARQASWEAFRAEAAHLESAGLRDLTGERLVEFAAKYREVAADLARARTYGADARVLAFLERVVSAGHNALYGLRGVRRTPFGRLLFRDLPRAAYRARRYVAVAALLFVVPGVIGYSLVREQPHIVHDILPDGMIARAEAGGFERGAGRGYAETPSPYLPIVATSIIANNVQVAFGAFAFGITAGIGTVLLLVFNGLFFGAVLGMFANYALADWILTFVAGHGVLELTAIFIAGAAGLIVARGLVAPGDLARRDALIVGGRWAAKLVGAAVCLLVLAGLIEGFLSASDAPAGFKLAVSATSGLLLVLLWMAGRSADGAVD